MPIQVIERSDLYESMLSLDKQQIDKMLVTIFIELEKAEKLDRFMSPLEIFKIIEDNAKGGN